MILAGSKVILREKRLADAQNEYLWRTDEELAQMDATQPSRFSYSEFYQMFQEELQHPFLGSQRFSIEAQDGTHIGNCMVYDIDWAREQAEMGIMIGDKRYWGQGYGTDAVKVLIEYLFASTTLNYLYLHTLDWNHRAQRSFAKCGFTPKGLRRKSAHIFVFMDLWKRDWMRMRANSRGIGEKSST